MGVCLVVQDSIGSLAPLGRGSAARVRRHAARQRSRIGHQELRRPIGMSDKTMTRTHQTGSHGRHDKGYKPCDLGQRWIEYVGMEVRGHDVSMYGFHRAVTRWMDGTSSLAIPPRP